MQRPMDCVGSKGQPRLFRMTLLFTLRRFGGCWRDSELDSSLLCSCLVGPRPDLFNSVLSPCCHCYRAACKDDNSGLTLANSNLLRVLWNKLLWRCSSQLSVSISCFHLLSHPITESMALSNHEWWQSFLLLLWRVCILLVCAVSLFNLLQIQRCPSMFESLVCLLRQFQMKQYPHKWTAEVQTTTIKPVPSGIHTNVCLRVFVWLVCHL